MLVEGVLNLFGHYYNNQNQYGWGNAAADILNAVLQRNAQRGEQKKQANLFGDVANFTNDLNNLDMGGQTTIQDLASRSNPNSNYGGSNIERKTMQGLLNTNFNQQTPTADMLGQGLSLLSPQQNGNTFSASNNSPGMLEQGNLDLTKRPVVKNQDGSISTVRSIGVNIDGKEYLIPTVSNDGRIMSDDEAVNEFKRTGQHLGVFSSPEASNQYAQTLHNQQAGMYGNKLQQQNFTNPLDKYSKENNPSQSTTSAPKSLNEQTALIRAQIAPAMKELIAKGYNPKDVLPLLQQATQDKIAEHTSTYQQQQINDLYKGFISKEAEANPNIKAMYAARLKQMGFDVTAPYKEFAPEYKSEKINTGGQQLGLSFNPKTGKYEQQFVVNNTASPDAVLNNETKIKTTQMNNDTSVKVAGMRGERGGGGSRANHYEEGPGTKGGKRLDPLEKQKYNELYQSTLEDIWDSATPEIRAQKIQQHAELLNELGYYMDRDVENDLRAITG